jgi:DNA-binding NtrC family response regulator
MARREIEKEAIDELSTYPWTGNIRELRNVIERLLILSNNVITKADVEAFAKPIFR